jgi:DNA-binding MarR family transcriptional regulator
MLVLWEQDGISVSTLGQRLSLDSGTLTPLLKRLEAAELLRRERDPKDQRNLSLALTDKGRALRAEAEKIPAGIVARLGMPVEELMALQEALSRVISASQRALAAPVACRPRPPRPFTVSLLTVGAPILCVPGMWGRMDA